MSAADHHSVLQGCRDAGVDDTLSKPFTEAELVALLAHWLGDAP